MNKVLNSFLGSMVFLIIFGSQFLNLNVIKAEGSIVGINYKAQVQNIGWLKPVEMGQEAGTDGKALRMETLNINLENPIPGMKLIYQAHVQDIGWQDWVNDGQNAGTIGQSLRMEAVRIKIVGVIGYHIQYQVHVQDIGWMPWVSDGDLSGTIGQSKRIEAIRINIVKDNNSITVPQNISLNYSTHVENIGWQNQFTDMDIAGTTGKGLRIEALKFNLNNIVQGMKIKYQMHVQNIGWQNWTENVQVAGTTGQGLRIEALRIQLDGVPGYHVQYQVHVQDIGWMPWVQDGDLAGTIGQSKRIEAIRIRLVKDQQEGLISILYLDQSNNNKTISDNSNLDITGWALNQFGNKEIDVYSDGMIIGKASMGLASVDANASNPGYPNGDKSGFDYVYKTANLSPGNHTIIVQTIGINQTIVEKSFSFNIPITTYTKYNSLLNDFINLEMKRTPAMSIDGEWRYAEVVNEQQGYFVMVNNLPGPFILSPVDYNNIKQQLSINVNPSNIVNDSIKKYEFLKLNYSDCTNADQLNSILKGVLSGEGQAFIDAAKTYNINPVYLAAHAILETGNGTSNLARGINFNGQVVYNLFGIQAVDSNPDASGSAFAFQKGWTSIDKAICGGAQWIANDYIGNVTYNQDTLYKMRWNPSTTLIWHQYATDVNWAASQVTYIKKCFDMFPNAQLKFDIPVFN